MGKITVVGMGPGGRTLITPQAMEAVTQARTVLAARRHIAALPKGEGIHELEGMQAALGIIDEALAGGDVAVCVSGDPGMYSMLSLLKKRFPQTELSVISGIGSLQYLCDRLGESRENAAVLSAHGRELPIRRLIGAVGHNHATLMLLDEAHNPGWLCEILLAHGLGHVQVAIGEQLSYPEERIITGTPVEIAALPFDGLCVARVFNPRPAPETVGFGLPDDAFIRGETPMTKSEVRAIILSRLNLDEHSVVWDIGAGTGSVSVECARLCRCGIVHALERDGGALQLIEENKDRFCLNNLLVHNGEAPEALGSLPTPSHVFVGGSGGELEDILAHISARGSGIRVVVAAVTLETAALAAKVMGDTPYENMAIVQASISRGRRVGRSNLMIAQNPVTLVSAWTGDCT